MAKLRSQYGSMDLDQTVAVCGQDSQPATGKSAAPVRHTHREPLSTWGQRLLDNLPSTLSLANTAKYYPHVVNRLALAWDNARDLEMIIDDLLLDDRPQRQGFPLEVLSELTEARQLRVAQLDPKRRHRF